MKHCALSDTGNWTNQNVVFTKALVDMFPLAKVISLKGAPRRKDAMPRSAHFKPEFEMPGIEGVDDADRLRQAEALVRSVRSQHAQMAEIDDRHVRIPTANRN